MILCGQSVLLLAAIYAQSTQAASGLRVRCNIEGATVYLDGKNIGVCPVKDTPRAGRHKLLVEKPIDSDTVYHYRSEIDLTDGEIHTIDAVLQTSYTEEALYRLGKEDEYLSRFPKGKYARAINERQRREDRELREQMAKMRVIWRPESNGRLILFFPRSLTVRIICIVFPPADQNMSPRSMRSEDLSEAYSFSGVPNGSKVTIRLGNRVMANITDRIPYN